jgi:hypothetical protein
LSECREEIIQCWERREEKNRGEEEKRRIEEKKRGEE